MLSQRGRYAVKAMLRLAREEPDSACSVSRIAAEVGIPAKFLAAIMLDLRATGLVESHRGKRGGYRLARRAEHISFADILDAVQGVPVVPTCAARAEDLTGLDCTDAAPCLLCHVMEQGYADVAAVLAAATLADQEFRKERAEQAVRRADLLAATRHPVIA